MFMFLLIISFILYLADLPGAIVDKDSGYILKRIFITLIVALFIITVCFKLEN
jgi:hypothetical protein